MFGLSEEDLLELQRLMTPNEEEPGDLNQFLEDGLVIREKRDE